jgi:hypothetical protein
MVPEYLANGQWQPVLENLACTLNVFMDTAILPGGVAEGDLPLAWGYDLRPFHGPGEYTFRLTLSPGACSASPDGQFCVNDFQTLLTLTSNRLTVQVQSLPCLANLRNKSRHASRHHRIQPLPNLNSTNLVKRVLRQPRNIKILLSARRRRRRSKHRRPALHRPCK